MRKQLYRRFTKELQKGSAQSPAGRMVKPTF
jgi:hypothetical protein